MTYVSHVCLFGIYGANYRYTYQFVEGPHLLQWLLLQSPKKSRFQCMGFYNKKKSMVSYRIQTAWDFCLQSYL